MDGVRLAVVAFALLLMARSAVAPLEVVALDTVLLVLGLVAAAVVPWTCVANHRRHPTASNRTAAVASLVGLVVLVRYLAVSTGEDGTSVGSGLAALVALVGLLVGAVMTRRHTAERTSPRR